MIRLPGGTFRMGNGRSDGYPKDGEGPVHPITLSPFRLDRTTVTNAQYAAFVAATGFRTESEAFGWSFVFGGLLPDDFEETRAVAAAPWWRQVYGADWRHPEGPQSSIDDRPDHPVVHVSWNDAMAYAHWAGKRLPTEAEWEYAARGGLDGFAYPWGADREPGGTHLMNVFQGRFPGEPSPDDGYYGTAPVGAFPPNAFGLHEMTGNVWEWCSDWFAPDYYLVSPPDRPARPGVRHEPAPARRLVPLPRVVLLPVSRGFAQRQHARTARPATSASGAPWTATDRSAAGGAHEDGDRGTYPSARPTRCRPRRRGPRRARRRGRPARTARGSDPDRPVSGSPSGRLTAVAAAGWRPGTVHAADIVATLVGTMK